MALTNNIRVPAVISTTGGRRKYTVTVADLVALGAFTSGDIVLDTLPAGSVVMSDRIKHSECVDGTSFSAATARLVFNGTNLGSGALGVFTDNAVGTTEATSLITGHTAVNGDVGTTNQLKMHITSTGGNLAAASQGTISAWIDYKILL